jgi:hypothetical protein
MAVRIMLDGPSRGAGPRLGRVLAVVAGLPLIVAGVAGLYGVILIGIFLLSVSPISAKDQHDAILTGAVCAAAALVGLGLGIRLLRGRRRLVLFLRRFGFDDATRAVSFAATKAIGRSWRLVTLDDDKVKAVGGASGPRRLAGVTALLALVPLAWVAWWMHTHSTDSLIRDVTNSSGPVSGGPGNATGIVNVLANAIVTAIVSGVIVGLILLTAVVTGIVAGMSSLLLATTYGFARHAEHARKGRIQSPKEVRTRSQAIMRRSRHIFAPRLVVVTVAHPLWQQAVHAFARTAAAAIIDISVPSENLRWEISTLLPAMGRNCILVGRLDLLTTQLIDGRTVFTSPLQRDIDGHEVLAYRPDQAGVRHFSRALRATIEARAHGR